MSNYFWLIIAVVFAVIEGLTLGLATIWFSIGALAAWIAYLLNFSWELQLFIFVAVSGLMLVFTRPIVKKYLKIGKVKTNAEELIGKEGKVLEKIDNINASGKVKVKGQIWTSRSDNDGVIDENEIVKVLRIEGVKLIVKKI